MKEPVKKNHPEVDEIKNICDVTPDDASTKDICDKVNKDKKFSKNKSKSKKYD